MNAIIDMKIPLQNVGMIVRALAEGAYDVVAAVTQQIRLTEDEIREAIVSYGRTLTVPPGDVPPDMRVNLIEGTPRRIVATMSLWTVEEGQSDLSLEMQMVEVAPGMWLSEIHNIHVL
jgi:hypothetical protein